MAQKNDGGNDNGKERTPPVVPPAANGGPKQKVEIVVIGDVYWDTVIVPLPRDHNDTGRPQPEYARIQRPGGAWLLQSLIETATKPKDGTATNIKIKGYGIKKKDRPGIDPLLGDANLKPDKCRRALTIMELFDKDADEKEKVYWISQKQGYGWIARPGDSPPDETYFVKLNEALEEELKKSNRPHRIVVISETENHNFRHVKGIGDLVAKMMDGSPDSSLILSMASPLVNGALWDTIKGRPDLLKRTLVVISASSLREAGLFIREGGAQETIAQDLAGYVESCHPIFEKLKCHVLFRFDYDWVSKFNNEQQHNKQQRYIYNYTSLFKGGPQSNPVRYGTMSGYGKILVASIVTEMVERINDGKSSPFNSLGKGICDGLRRGVAHFSNGFAPAGRFETEPTPFENLFKIPLDDLFRRYDTDDKGQPKQAEVHLPVLAKVRLPFSQRRLRNWSRVEWFKECVESAQQEGSPQEKFDMCLASVVKNGLDKTLKAYTVYIGYKGDKEDKEVGNDKEDKRRDEYPISLPFLTLGDLTSVDRDEIEGIYDIYRLIRIYLQDNTRKKPLSLAVFGPPRTGKSRAVKEILKAVGSPSGKSGNVDISEYNLAQFTEPRNLTTAFHKAQDVALSDRVPLIFFDEFDATLDRPYGWLKYFLAPMQDGKFKAADTEDTYTVGRAIFVFAGGTAKSFIEFKNKANKNKSAKRPDFVSRLKAYLNIKGINNEGKGGLAQAIDRTTQAINAKPLVNDRLALRRAIILRSILEMKAKEILDEKKTLRSATDSSGPFLESISTSMAFVPWKRSWR